MKKIVSHICLLILFAFFLFPAFAQRYSIDSLKKVLQTQKEDTVKINVLLKISDAYLHKGNQDTSLQYANLALSMAKKMHNDEENAHALMQISAYYNAENNSDSAIALAAQSLESIKKTNKTEDIAGAYWTLANLYTNENRGMAIENFYIAIKLYDQLGNKKLKAACLAFMAFNYYWQKNYVESFNVFQDALALFNQLGDSKSYEVSLCYIYMADIYRIRYQNEKALAFDSIGLKLSLSHGQTQMAANAYSCLGDIFTAESDSLFLIGRKNDQHHLLIAAISNYIQSLHSFRDVADTGGMGDCYTHLTEVNMRLHEFSEAQRAVDSALICAQIIKFKDNFEDAYLAQAKLDSATGNFNHGFEAFKKYVVYRDSIFNEETTKKILESRMQYDFDKKEAITSAETEKTKTRQYMVIGALALVVLAVLIITFIQFRSNKQKQKANLLLERQKQKVESTLTELKSTQAQLIQSEKMASLGELTAGIAHEIQNPLNFVNNFSEVNRELIEELKGERQKAEGIRNTGLENEILNDIEANEEKINHHGKRADAIVKGMLQHSRSSVGVKEPTDINALADEYLRLSYHGLRAKDKSFNATIKTDFDNSTGKINIIPQDIGRVLLNLYNNAFYAVNEKGKPPTPKGEQGSPQTKYEPTVTVTSRLIQPPSGGRVVEIKVIDNGGGISQKVIDKIFQPFFTTKPTGQGTGLGLSLSYDIIKAHGGEIKVETKEGEGTEFIIELPLK